MLKDGEQKISRLTDCNVISLKRKNDTWGAKVLPRLTNKDKVRRVEYCWNTSIMRGQIHTRRQITGYFPSRTGMYHQIDDMHDFADYPWSQSFMWRMRTVHQSTESTPTKVWKNNRGEERKTKESEKEKEWQKQAKLLNCSIEKLAIHAVKWKLHLLKLFYITERVVISMKYWLCRGMTRFIENA